MAYQPPTFTPAPGAPESIQLTAGYQPFNAAPVPAPVVTHNVVQVQPTQPVQPTVVVVHPDLKPENYIVFSVVTILCCCWVFGFIALIHSFQVDAAWASGDKQRARQASDMAKKWNFAGIIAGLAAYVVTGIIVGVSIGITASSANDYDYDYDDDY